MSIQRWDILEYDHTMGAAEEGLYVLYTDYIGDIAEYKEKAQDHLRRLVCVQQTCLEHMAKNRDLKRQNEKAHAYLVALLDQGMPPTLPEAVEYIIDHSNAGWMRVGEELKRIANLEREKAELLAALESIRVYGMDTLSERVDGSDDQERLRTDILEMTSQAQAAINAEHLPKEEPLETDL